MSLRTAAHALVLLVALGLVHAEPIARYAGDQHYRTHFAVLWVLFAIAAWKGLRGPFRPLAGLRSARDLCGWASLVVACCVLAIGALTGSSTLQRTALAGTFFGLTCLSLPANGMLRCAGFAGFLLLCFGVPFSAWFAITKQLARGLELWLALPAGLLGYRVEGLSAVFPHFRLTVTGDCSGFNQLVTFLAVAALGLLVGASSARRTLGMVVLAILLAYVANVARLWVLLVLVACGVTRSITDDTWHQGIGFLVDLPFLVLLVAILLRTHRVVPSPALGPPTPMRGIPVALVGLVQLGLVCWLDAAAPVDPTPPAWFARANAAPGARVLVRAASEEREKVTYGTPWLVNARFANESGGTFDLFAFETRSREHLNVHTVANCLEAEGGEFRYGTPLDLDGRRLYPFAIRTASGERHGWYLFRVAGEDRDDTWRTQLAVLRARAFGGVPAIGMVRVIFPGAGAQEPAAYEAVVLRWAAELMTNTR